MRHGTARALGSILAIAGLAIACSESGGMHAYRLGGSGDGWEVAGADRVLDDLRPRYPEFFAVILDPARSDEPSLLPLREDLERQPSDRRNFDALNAIAIGYFELNHRSESERADASVGFLTGGFRAAHLLAVPWRAYGEIVDPRLRDAILDFFEDAGTGEKRAASVTARRLVPIVRSLADKESDPARLARIESLARRIGKPKARSEPQASEGTR